MKEGGAKVINITIPEELHMQLKIESVREKATIKDVVRKAIEEYLAKKAKVK